MPPDLVAKLMLLMTLMTARRPSLPGQQPDTLQQQVHRLGTAAAPYGYTPATLSGSSTAFTDRAAAAKLLHNTIRQVLADTGAAALAPSLSSDTNSRSTLSRRRPVATYIRGTAGDHVTNTPMGSGVGIASSNVNSNASLIPSKDNNTTTVKSAAATKIKNDTDVTTTDTPADSDKNNTLVDSNTAAITVNASTNATLVERNDTFTLPYSSINITSPSSSATVAHNSTGHAPADNDTRAATVVSSVNATRPDRRTVITRPDTTPNAGLTINTNATSPQNNISVASPDISADVTLTSSNSNTRKDSNITNTLPHTGLTNATSSESDAKAKPSGDNITATDITFNATLGENHTTPTATSTKGSRAHTANSTQPDNNVHLAVTNEANLSLPGRNITLALTSNIKVTLKGGNITVELTDSNVIAKAASTNSSASPTGNGTARFPQSNATVATENINTTLSDNILTVAMTNDTNAVFPGSSLNETHDNNPNPRQTGNIRKAQAEDVLAFPSGGSFNFSLINNTNNWTGSKPDATHTKSNSLSKSGIPQILFKSLSTFSNILHRNRSINYTNASHLLTALMETKTHSQRGESGTPTPPTERQANQTSRDTGVIASSQNNNVDVTFIDQNSTDEVTSYTVAAPPITSNASEATALPHRDTSGTGAKVVTDSTLAATSATGTSQTDHIEVVEFDSVSTTTIARSATTYELPERERNPVPRDYEDIDPDVIMTETSTRTTHFHHHYDPMFDEHPIPPPHVNWEGLYYTKFADLIPLNAVRNPRISISADKIR